MFTPPKLLAPTMGYNSASRSRHSAMNGAAYGLPTHDVPETLRSLAYQADHSTPPVGEYMTKLLSSCIKR